MGDFWHCDIRKYKNINYINQYNAIIRDKSKNTYIKNQNMNVLYLWENDINKNLDLCSELIKLYINNEGNLNNYHSFNYNITNNNINLSKKLIIPYMQRNKNYINDKLDLSIKEKISRFEPDKHIKFNCDYCGIEKETMLLHYSNCKNHFCSCSCKSKYENTSIQVKCKHCDKDFLVEQSKYIKNKDLFCSLKCNKEYRRKDFKITECDYCNKTITVKKINSHNYCNRNCYNEHRENTKGSKQEDKWIAYNCDTCGKETSSLIINYNKHKNHFCCKKCYDNFQNKELINYSCDYCGKQNKRKQANYKKSINHFCNHSCAISYKNKNRSKEKSA
jgi:hypothetical protein